VASGAVVSALTHVNDIVPTLLDAAGIAPHQGQYAGRTVQALSGRSLLPLLQGKADYAYRPDEPLGYELAGSAALFLGDYKLVKNIAPLGDGQWRLFNLRQDPGETRDLQSAQPEIFASMRAAYDKYAQDFGVLPVPEGFDLQKAGLHYAIHHYVLPKLREAWPVWLALVGAIFGFAFWRRRRKFIS